MNQRKSRLIKKSILAQASKEMIDTGLWRKKYRAAKKEMSRYPRNGRKEMYRMMACAIEMEKDKE